MRWVPFQFHLLVVLWGFTGILGSVISLSPAALVVWRTFLASVVFFLWLRVRSPERLRAEPGCRFGLFRNGMILGVHWICFFGAIELSNVSVGLAGLASLSLFTALTEAVSERRKPRGSEVWLSIMVLAGLLFVVAGSSPGGLSPLGPDALKVLPGLLVALLGAFLAALFAVLNRRYVVRGIPATTILVHGMPGSCVAAMLVIVLVPTAAFEFEMPATADWPYLLLLVVACTFLAYIWYNLLMRHLTAYTSNMIANLEPVYGTFLAALILKEHEGLNLLFYTGLAIIVLANVVHARLEGKRRDGGRRETAV